MIVLDHGKVTILEGDPPTAPELTITCDQDTYLAIGYRALSIRDALTAGLLWLEGDNALLDTCFEVLRFPPYPAMEALLAQPTT